MANIMTHSEMQLTMLKPKGTLNELPLKSKASNQIWPLFVYRKEGYDCDEVSETPADGLSVGRLRDQRDDSTDTGVRIYLFISGVFSFINGKTAESFHCAIGPILNIAQVFGLFPVSGVRTASASKLQFKAFSFLTVYSSFMGIMMLFVTIVSLMYMVKSLTSDSFHTRGGIGAATVGAAFYGNSLLGSVLFFCLATRWIPLQIEWRAMERYIDSNSSKVPSLRWKFFLITAVVLLLALIEHILSVFNNVDGVVWNASNSTFRDFLEVYTLRSHKFIFEILDYNYAFGLYIFVVSKVATFTWNFTDLFVILVATGLAERYKSLNKKLAKTVTKYRPTFDWCDLREDYAILSCLVKRVDDHISPIILLSFANNLYFICLQLLNGLSIPEGKSLVCTAYFFGSFAFLIGRTCAVTLLTARIYDQSKEALPYLYNCSAASYGIEAQRLQYQLATDEVVLTGLRFFSITRNFMLAVAGAIMTYEVVLLQFSRPS